MFYLAGNTPTFIQKTVGLTGKGTKSPLKQTVYGQKQKMVVLGGYMEDGEASRKCWLLDDAGNQHEKMDAHVDKRVVSACQTQDGFVMFEKSDNDIIRCHQFTSSTRQWKRHKGLPTARILPASVVLGDELYVIGGGDTEGTVLDVCESLNLITNTWTMQPPLPQRMMPSAAVIGNDIFVLFYFFPDVKTSKEANNRAVVKLSPITKQWSHKAPLPTDFLVGDQMCNQMHIQVAALSDSLLVTGGDKKSGQYFPSTDTWVMRAPTLMPHVLGSMVVHKDRVLLL